MRGGQCCLWSGGWIRINEALKNSSSCAQINPRTAASESGEGRRARGLLKINAHNQHVLTGCTRNMGPTSRVLRLSYLSLNGPQL